MKKQPPVIELDLDEMTPEGVRAAFVVRFGPECAAWLVNEFRQRFRRVGKLRAHMPAKEELPPWFDIAVSFLRDHRQKKWGVRRWVENGVITFEIEWKGKRWRGLPASIRRLS